MSIKYSIAELYKLIRDNPNDSKYLQLLEGKKQEIIRKTLDTVNVEKKDVCLYKPGSIQFIECTCLTCQKSIEIHGYNQKAMLLILKNMLNNIENVNVKQEKINLVTIMFQKILLTNDGLSLINSNEKFKQAVKEKLIYFYNENHLFEPYRWYRKIFNERIPIYTD